VIDKCVLVYTWRVLGYMLYDGPVPMLTIDKTSLLKSNFIFYFFGVKPPFLGGKLGWKNICEN